LFVTTETIFCQLLYKQGWNGDGNEFLLGLVGMGIISVRMQASTMHYLNCAFGCIVAYTGLATNNSHNTARTILEY